MSHEMWAERALFCVAAGLMPTPCVCDHLFQIGPIGRPLQFCSCAQRSRHQFGTIPCAARAVGDVNRVVCDMFGLINHLTNRKSIARAQVKHATAAPRLQPFQPQNMRIHQIADMDISWSPNVAQVDENTKSIQP